MIGGRIASGGKEVTPLILIFLGILLFWAVIISLFSGRKEGLAFFLGTIAFVLVWSVILTVASKIPVVGPIVWGIYRSIMCSFGC
jgi:hypothetical protein